MKINFLVSKLGRTTNIRYYDYNIFMNLEINNLVVELNYIDFNDIL